MTSGAINNKLEVHPTVTVMTGKDNVDFIVDTGATVNLMEEFDYLRLKDVTLQKSSRKIFLYDSEIPLTILGWGCSLDDVNVGGKLDTNRGRISHKFRNACSFLCTQSFSSQTSDKHVNVLSENTMAVAGIN
ncbi:hypothetical protein BpHYR1_030181 [Paramuricea clavata]|uniref:Uncharacterized protein n=1 Tax=Paramuricea clavata TaxID=317549 RepID=A0A6S7FMY7_PARCT|nr:hypothetical protein BpHYR1_030181 [Paramuricea clavata]